MHVAFGGGGGGVPEPIGGGAANRACHGFTGQRKLANYQPPLALYEAGSPARNRRIYQMLWRQAGSTGHRAPFHYTNPAEGSGAQLLRTAHQSSY